MSARKQGRGGTSVYSLRQTTRLIPLFFSPPVSLWFGAGGLQPFPLTMESQMVTYIHFLHLPDDSLWGILISTSFRRPPLPPGIHQHSLITTVHFGSLGHLWEHDVWHEFSRIRPSGL